MNSSSGASLYKATALTFEGMGFLLPNPELSEAQRKAPSRSAVEVRFNGPLRGRLLLIVSGNILPGIVMNMLGEDAEISEEAQRDALGELANVICGNVLPEVGGADGVFTLETPRPVVPPGRGEPWSSEVHVGLEGGRADVYLQVEESAGERAA
jgi:CheY-specific phosphatase CheX